VSKAVADIENKVAGKMMKMASGTLLNNNSML
jgi:hypothetical protein